MKISKLNPNELLVVGVGNKGSHVSGLAEFAYQQGWLTLGNSGGLDITEQVFAINIFSGLDAIASQLTQLVVYKKANPNVTIFLTDFGLRNAEYSRFELWNAIAPHAEYFDFTYAELLNNTRQGFAPLRGEFYLAKLEESLENGKKYQVTKVFYDDEMDRWVAFETWMGYFNTFSEEVNDSELINYISNYLEKLLNQKQEYAEATATDFDWKEFYEAEALTDVTTEDEARKFIKERHLKGYKILTNN